MDERDPDREVDPGEPIEELARLRWKTSDTFFPSLRERLDRRERAAQTAEFTLAGLAAVIREYAYALLALLGSPTSRKE